MADHVDIVTSVADFQSLECDWQRLWSQSPRREVFTSFSWAKAFIDSHGPDVQLVVPVLNRGGMVQAILPLVRVGGTLHFLGSQYADYVDVLCERELAPRSLATLVSALGQSRIEWSHCVLRNVSEFSEVRRMLGDDGTSELMWRVSRKQVCPAFVPVVGERKASFASLARKETLRRYERKLERLGPVRLRHLESDDEIAAHLPRYFEQHMRRRAYAGEGQSVFAEQTARDMYERVARRLAPREFVRFSVLEAGTRAAAYHLGFEIDGRLLFYSPSFELDLWDYCPGIVMLKRLFEYADDKGVSEFDFSIGGESYKSRYANVTRVNEHIVIYRRGIRGRLAQSSDTIKMRVSAVPAASTSLAACRRIMQRFRQDGIAGGLRHAVGRIGRRIYERRRVLIFRYGDPEPSSRIPEPETAGDLTIEPGSLSEYSSYWLDDSTKCRPALAHQRLKAGDNLWFVRRSPTGALVHVAWTGMRTSIDLSVEFGSPFELELDEEGCYVFDCGTPQAYRKQGVYATVLSIMSGEQARRGVPVWICCLAENGASRRGIERAGFRQTHSVTQTKLLNAFRWISTEHTAVATPHRADTLTACAAERM